MATITVPDETRRKQVVVGGTPQTSFTFDWVIFDETTDIRMWSGTTELTIVTHFTIVGTAGTDGGFDGGTITMAGSYVSGLSNVTATIQGNTALDRATNLAATGPLDIDLLNKDLNRFITILQQIDDKYDRTLQVAETTTLTLPLTVPEGSVGSELIGWNAGLTALEVKVPADLSLTTVTAFASTILDDPTASDARTTLGLAIDTDVQSFDADTLKADTADTLTSKFTYRRQLVLQRGDAKFHRHSQIQNDPDREHNDRYDQQHHRRRRIAVGYHGRDWTVHCGGLGRSWPYV